MIKHLIQSPTFTLDWDPELDLQTEGEICMEEECLQLAARP